jgi:hypothetical protein
MLDIRRALPAILVTLALLPRSAALGQSGGTPPAAAPPAIPAAAALSAPSAPSTTTAPALPPGVLRVLFGTAVRDRSFTGVPRCSIPEPLPAPPRFAPGTTEITYAIVVDPQVVKAVTAKVVGDLGCPEPWSLGCPGYAACGSAICQNQYGATVSCPNGKPLNKGSYKLSLAVGDKTVEVPFEIQ